MRLDTRVRRCKCHKAIVNLNDEDGMITRNCSVTWEEIRLDQTYLATFGNTDEIMVDAGPDVQRGTAVND